jgi:hypothetical protein
MESNEVLSLIIHEALQYASKDRTRTRHSLGATYALQSAGRFLLANGGTIDWCGPEADIVGYETIYQYMAGEHFAKDGKYKEKVDYANNQAHIMRNGVNSIRERLLERCGEILFVVPRYSNRREIQVITTNPDYAVNDSGQTAAEIYLDRDMKSMSGQVRTFLERNSVLKGKDAAKHAVMGEVMTLLENVRQYPTHPLPVALPGPSAH